MSGGAATAGIRAEQSVHRVSDEFLKDFIKILTVTIAFAKYVGSLRMVASS